MYETISWLPSKSTHTLEGAGGRLASFSVGTCSSHVQDKTSLRVWWVKWLDDLSISIWDFPDGSVVKNQPANVGYKGLIPGSGRSPGGENSNLLHSSCLENPTDRGTWWATIYSVAKSRTWLSMHASMHAISIYRIESISYSTFLHIVKLCWALINDQAVGNIMSKITMKFIQKWRQKITNNIYSLHNNFSIT